VKKITLLLFLSIIQTVYCQRDKENFKLGRATRHELNMTVYEKDSTASAVVLEERGHEFVDEDNDYRFRRDIYKRIKIFDKSEFERATISINTSKTKKVIDIKAITYTVEGNKIKKTHLLEKNIYVKKISEYWTQTSFTLPNIEEGCVIEFKYSIINPYSKIEDWVFQSDIPKIKSDFSASIPGNWKQNIRLRSYRNLDRNNTKINKGCIYIPGIGEGDCSFVEYGFDHVPAFKSEDYMLSEENFKAKVIFEPISFTSTDGRTTKYTKTWKDADKTLRKNFFDGQTSKAKFFRKNLPNQLLTIKDNFSRAQAIYTHIQEKMNWNKRYWSPEKLKVRNTYEEKTGAVDAINLTLYNALTAANIEAYLVALSTRNNGTVTKLFPSVSEFNYVIVKVVIDNKTYFLDATDKQLLFGEIPMRCLNGEGRVLDSKKGSYWELIKPSYKSYVMNNISFSFDENQLNGKIITSKNGYYAYNERKKTNTISDNEYIENFETKYPFLEVNDFNTIPSKTLNGTFKTYVEVSIPDIEKNDLIRFNPFIVDYITKNPFKLEERHFPVDFGYSWSKSHNIKIKIPEGYIVTKMPKSKKISLPNKGGSTFLSIKQQNNQISIYAKTFLSKAIYTNKEYHYLKEFYNKIIQMQDCLIELKKQ